MNLISINSEKCIHCYSCVKTCPVKAIKVNEKDDVYVEQNRCIGCGSCLNVCSTNAIEFINSVDKVKQLLASDTPVFAICDPEISAEFTDISDYKKFVSMIKMLGFKKVFSASMAVEMIAQRYQQLFESDFKGKYYISANCPVVVNLIEKFYPKLQSNLAPVISPVGLSAQMIKKQFTKTGIYLVYISPCLAQKAEIKRFPMHSRIDAVLLFKELRQMFDEIQVKENQVEYSEFDNVESYKGLLYPISNGILQAGGISENLLTGNVITTDGKNNVMSAVSSFDFENENLRSHLNLFFCQGCLMGPGTSKDATNKFIRQAHVLEYAKKRMKQFDLEEWENDMASFKELDTKCHFQNQVIHEEEPSEEEIKEMMKTLTNNNLNNASSCGMCGFGTCRELAVGILKGIATKDMCLKQTVKNEKNYSQFVKQANEQITTLIKTSEETRQTLEETEKKLEINNQTVQIVLGQINTGVVVVNHDMEVILANENMINMIGEDAHVVAEVIPGLKGAKLSTLLNPFIINIFQYAIQQKTSQENKDVEINHEKYRLSVLYIASQQIAIGTFRPFRSQQVDIDDLIKNIQSAIDENLTMVQQIGFVLGEGASNTERKLNQIIESFQSSGDEK